MLDKCLREDFIAKVAEDAKTMQEQGGGRGGEVGHHMNKKTKKSGEKRGNWKWGKGENMQ